MYENMSGITIRGKCFDETKKMVFFPEETDRISIVYGKNGSGKSTLSEGFYQLASDVLERDLEVVSIDREEKLICIDDEEKKNIHVFNEAYIDKNIRIGEKGLNTIVLFGEQVDVEEQIKKIQRELEKSKKEYSVISEENDKYNDVKNVLSPNFYFEKIKKKLKAEGGWAEKDSKIKNAKQNSTVSNKVISEICELTVTETIADLEKKYKETKELLEKVSNKDISFPEQIVKKEELAEIENDIIILLAKKIEKPILTNREKMILIAIEDGFQGRVEESKKMFIDETTDVCPYCYQTLSNDYKHQMLNSIQKVLNKDVEEHTNKLKKICLDEYMFDKTKYCSLDLKLSEDIEKQIEKCNQIIRQYKQKINNKLENIYTPINIKSFNLNDAIIELNNLLELLEQKRVEFNNASKQGETIKKELVNINKQIAHKAVEDDYNTYKKQLMDKNDNSKRLEAQFKKINEFKAKLTVLEETKKNVAIAIAQINKSLEYVFFSKDRLSIELKDDLYYLKSNGRDVKPCDVSCGERNIIALCYFFTQIMNNLEVKNFYSVDRFVIIDDPVSSFDFENKIGIISFLKQQIRNIILGNNNSKVLLFSHDLTTIFDLQKVTEEIGKLTKKVAKVGKTTAAWLEIKEGKLDRFSKNRNEYTELLKLVYNYAKDKSGIDSINIGNTMRRVLEAFATFNYKKGIQDISCDIEIMENVPHKEYFENLMYRLVLHNESHFAEQIQNFHDGINFYDFISEEEKQKTAREVLCLIYLLNPLHVKAHLSGTAVNEIIQWTEKIV